MIRVLLADDHPLIISGFAPALAGYGITVVGGAKTPEDAINKYQELLPDVLVMDIRFGEASSGLDAAKEICKKFHAAKIVFLSQYDQDSFIREAYRAGGLAFITKDCDREILAAAIKSACEGKQYFLPHVAERLAQFAIRGDISPQSQLEEREIEIFILMAQGRTNTEMAEIMNLSPKTISNTSQAIKEKLGMHRQADITLLAVKHGLINVSNQIN